MKESIEKTKKHIEEILQNNEEHQDKKIDFILIKPDTNETLTIASNGADEMIHFAPYTIDEQDEYNHIADWDFSWDEYFFKDLQDGYEIGYITDEIHYNLWNTIQEFYPDDINYKDGVQNYLQYCADKGITKEYLDNKTNLDTPDIMKYFEGLAFLETMEYKGYIIEADDNNFDNDKENLVNIYENKEDFDKKESIETVSLNTIGLKQNIRDYIDEYYIDKSVVDKEKAYFTFVLGYDLLNDDFKNLPNPECDLTYGFCEKIAENFINSDSYKYDNLSAYELLEKYVHDNKTSILKDYEKFIGVENIYFDENKTLLYKGNRGEQPIALIEWKKAGRKEYVVAIDYTIDEDRIYWSRGYYYYDLNAAEQDFNKVINGEYLVSNNMDTLDIKFVGIDNWDRPVYKDCKGNLYKDINLGQGMLALCTSCNNDFYGEPDVPINDDIKVNIVQKFRNEQERKSYEQDR